jgi:hypothetical protein
LASLTDVWFCLLLTNGPTGRLFLWTGSVKFGLVWIFHKKIRTGSDQSIRPFAKTSLALTDFESFFSFLKVLLQAEHLAVMELVVDDIGFGLAQYCTV